MLLKIHKDGVIDMVAVEGVIFDIFSAGSETSATTLEWVMAELMKNPAAMVKATAEVRRAFEGDGTVDEGKLGELPYMRLVIRETFRLHPPLPLMLPRECQEPCKVLGFDVLKGTQVIVNTWALGRDERSWGPDAAEFRPERFESGAGVDVDFRGTDFRSALGGECAPGWRSAWPAWSSRLLACCSTLTGRRPTSQTRPSST